MRCRHDRGQVAPLLLLLVVLTGVIALLLGRIGGQAVARARARTAADAAALAGAAGGRDAAEQVASANGATLQSFSVTGSDTEVVVAVGVAHATATARTTGDVGAARLHRGLAPVLLATLTRAEQLLGRSIPAAPADGGMGVLVPPEFVAGLVAVAGRAGLCQPSPVSDPVHFVPCPASRNL